MGRFAAVSTRIMLALGLLTALMIDAPAARASDGAAPSLTGYDGGFFLRGADDAFKIRLKGRLQTRFTFMSEDAGPDREADYAVSIPRARLRVDGHAFSPALQYVFQMELGGGFTYLRDYYVDAGLLPGVLHLQVGQFRRPFSRQHLTSSGSQEFVDRAITDRAFGAGRDLGLMLHNDLWGSPTFEWAVGLFNGFGDRPTFSGEVTNGTITRGGWSNVPDKFKPMAVVRVGYNYGGIRGYREADLEGGGLRFALGLSGKAAFNAASDDDSFASAEVDYALKYRGFATTGAFYFGTEQTGGRFADQAYAGLGMHAQAGYVFSRRYQISARYALVAPRWDDNVHEVLGVLGVYFFGHDVKLQIDGGALLREELGVTRTDGRVRAQLQFQF